VNPEPGGSRAARPLRRVLAAAWDEAMGGYEGLLDARVVNGKSDD
jgi:hypothetical protein